MPNQPVVIFGAVCFILALVVALPLYFNGYKARLEWNSQLVRTTCIYDSYLINSDICTRSCNCYKTCSGSGSSQTCRSSCGTCSYPCFSAYYTLRYTAQSQTESQIQVPGLSKNQSNSYKIQYQYQYKNYTSIIFFEKKGSYSAAFNDLIYYKPIGKQIACYYFTNEPYKMVETPFHDVTFLVFAIIFFIISGIGYFGGVFGAIIND